MSFDYGILNTAGDMVARFCAPLTVKSNTPVFVKDTLSLKRVVSRRTAQRWEIEGSLEPLNTTAHKLQSLLVQSGSFAPVSIAFPQNYGADVNMTCSSPVVASGLVNGTTVTLSGLNGVIPEGRYVTFGSDPKLYMLTGDASPGNLSVGVFPPLRNAVSGTMKYSGIIIRMFIDTDSVSGMVYSDGILMDNGTIKLLEQL
jgi:hypothetical protein